MAYESPRSDRPSDAQLTQPTRTAPVSDAENDALAARDRDNHGVLWSALHERLGNRFAALTLGAGPTDSFELLMLQILEVSEATGMDMTPLLPWNAPLTWNEQVAGLADRLWSVWPQTAPAPGLMPGSGIDVDGPALDGLSLDALGVDGALDAGAGQVADSAGFASSSFDAGLGGDSGLDGGGLDAISPLGGGFGDAMVSRDAAPGDIEGQIDHILRTSGQGQPLSEAEQSVLEEVHGKRIPEIRVHRGSAAAEAGRLIAARAVTIGSDIFLGENGGNTDTPAGIELLVHEATHVLQDQQGRLPAARGDGLQVSSPSQPHEREAEAVGREARQAFVTGELGAAPEVETETAQTAPTGTAPTAASETERSPGFADDSAAELAASAPDDAASFDQTMGEISPMGEAGDALLGHMEGQIDALSGGDGGVAVSRFAGLARSTVSSAVETVGRRAIRQNTTEGESKDVSATPQPGNALEDQKSTEATEVRGAPLEDSLKRTREKLGQGLFDSALESENGFSRVEYMQQKLGHDMLGHLTGGREGNPDRFMAEAEEIAGLNDIAREAVDGLVQAGGTDVSDAIILSRVLPGRQLDSLMASDDKAATNRMVEIADALGGQAEATLTAFTEGLGEDASEALHGLLAGEGSIGAEDLRVMRDQGIRPTLMAELSDGLTGKEITDTVANLGAEVVKELGAELGGDALSTLAEAGLEEGQINDLRATVQPESLRALMDKGIEPETIAQFAEVLPHGALNKLAARLPGPLRPPGSDSQDR